MDNTLAKNASESQAHLAHLSNANAVSLGQSHAVLGSKDILDELARRGIEKKDIARVLNIDPSQVSRLYAGDGSTKPRQLKHDEAVRLVEAFQLELVQQVPTLPTSVWRLVVHHVAAALGSPLAEDDPRLEDAAADLAAFSRFVRSRPVQGMVQAADHFFHAMQSRREPEPADQPETDPQRVR